MDFLLCAAALLILLLAGLGAGSLILPRGAPALEAVSLAPLVGAAFVSLSWFGLSFLLSGAALRGATAAACLAVGVGGLLARRGRIRWPWGPRADRWSGPLGALVAVQGAAVAWLTTRLALGWDGLLNWEIKARIAYLNGGSLPASYFADPTRLWSHPGYPLFVPLSEVWVYSWLGRADQGAAKLPFALFYLAGLGLLSAGAWRRGARGWRASLPALLLSTVPLAAVGDGSATSGYADFPLAVGYLAAVIYLLEYWRAGGRDALICAGVLGGLLPWIKQEGVVLWLCLMALAGARAASRRERRAWGLALLPGLLVWGGWQLFLRAAGPPPAGEFLPLSAATLWGNLWRAPLVARAAMGELLDWRHWGLLWPGALGALVWRGFRGPRLPAALPLAVALPVLLYSGIYLFSSWPSVTDHMESSFPRLLLHVSLVALLALNQGFRDGDSGRPVSRRDT